ncbi:MAG: DUF523 domain-containing protein [Candidatus Omnitrophota bacterium]
MVKSKKSLRPGSPEYIVSACLVGADCRWDGTKRKNAKLYQLYKQGRLIPVCPEKLGGLSAPHVPYEILGGSGIDVLHGMAKVFSKDGLDVTAQFIKGAEAVLDIAKSLGIKKAILKSKSPSCGYTKIYDGTFFGELVPGHGVTTALLLKYKIKIVDERKY